MDNVSRSSNSGIGIALVLFLIAAAFIIIPLAIPPSIVEIQGLSKIILVGFGVFLLIVAGIMITITRLYRKAAADQAFVRTGMGGQKAIIDGGAIVVPFLHEVVDVSLKTISLKVDRQGGAALITGDFLRADISAEFFIKVNKKDEDVISAATSLGEKASNHVELERFVTDKLVNALRTVAATKTLDELNTNRAEFAKAVLENVQTDLQHNGLTLESVTVSKLDQTPTSALNPEDNVFDAQGARRIAEITNKSKIERNAIEQDANRTVELKKVDTNKQLYSMEVDRATAEAEKDKNIQVAKATTAREAATTAAEQSRLTGVAEIESQQAIAVAAVMQEQQVAVANQAKEQAEREAEIGKEKAVEIASREKEISVAEAEKRRADAQSEQLAAEKERETAAQAVKTVTVTSEADRRKQQAIIDQQAESEKTKIQQNVEADVAAYTVTKKAEAEATSAEKQAEAKIKLAEADKTAQVLQAEGKKAFEMVPVSVAKEQVEVEKAKVAVEKASLENQTANAEIAKDLQIKLAEIAADRDARVAAASSFGEALSKANITMWTDPMAVARMSKAFIDGQAIGNYVDGAMNTMPNEVVDLAKVGFSAIGRAGSALVKKMTGVEIPPETVEAQLKDEIKNQKDSDKTEPKADDSK